MKNKFWKITARIDADIVVKFHEPVTEEQAEAFFECGDYSEIVETEIFDVIAIDSVRNLRFFEGD